MIDSATVHFWDDATRAQRTTGTSGLATSIHTSWRYPGLGHGAFDDVLLGGLTARASKRSRVPAPHARINRRQSHGRTAGRALRALVLFIEHVLLPEAGAQFGALRSPASQPVAFDLMGSDAMILI